MPKVYLTKKWILDWQSSDKSVTMALHSSVSLEMSKISMSAMPVSSTIKKPPQQVFPRIAGILPAAILSSHEMWNKHDVLRQRAQSHSWLLAARVVCFRDDFKFLCQRKILLHPTEAELVHTWTISTRASPAAAIDGHVRHQYTWRSIFGFLARRMQST
jgi:hypothetical protein